MRSPIREGDGLSHHLPHMSNTGRHSGANMRKWCRQEVDQACAGSQQTQTDKIRSSIRDRQSNEVKEPSVSWVESDLEKKAGVLRNIWNHMHTSVLWWWTFHWLSKSFIALFSLAKCFFSTKALKRSVIFQKCQKDIHDIRWQRHWEVSKVCQTKIMHNDHREQWRVCNSWLSVPTLARICPEVDTLRISLCDVSSCSPSLSEDSSPASPTLSKHKQWRCSSFINKV